MQKEIEILEFVRGVNLEFIDSLKNNGTKYLLIFDDSCEEICNSKAFVHIATAGRHRALSTIYIKHNFFHQFKIGDRVRISKYDLPFRKGYKPQYTQEVFEIVAISSRKPPTYTKKDEQDEIIRGNFYQKELIKVI